MRIRKKQLVITFGATTAALIFEEFAESHGVPGRLIPLPSEISAGCGLAWKTETALRRELIRLLAESGLSWEGMYETELY